MLLKLSTHLRHLLPPGIRLRKFIKLIFYLVFFTSLLGFMFNLKAVNSIYGENKCSNIGTFSLLSLYYTHIH